MHEHLKFMTRLKAIREAIGMTPEVLSAELGFHHHNIHDWEEGIRTPRLHSLIRWARKMGLELELRPIQKKIADQQPAAKIHHSLPTSTTTIIKIKKSRKLSLPGDNHG